MSGPQQQQPWTPPAATAGGAIKALPIAVGAGLAIGVFVGLLLIRGTGAEASAESASAEATPDASVVAMKAVDAGVSTTVDSAVKVAAAVDAGPVVKTATLTLSVTPADAEELEVTIDGEPLSGTTFASELDDKGRGERISVRAKAKGRRSFHKRLRLNEDQTLEITLRPRKRGTSGGSPTVGHGPGKIIDL